MKTFHSIIFLIATLTVSSVTNADVSMEYCQGNENAAREAAAVAADKANSHSKYLTGGTVGVGCATFLWLAAVDFGASAALCTAIGTYTASQSGLSAKELLEIKRKAYMAEKDSRCLNILGYSKEYYS